MVLPRVGLLQSCRGARHQGADVARHRAGHPGATARGAVDIDLAEYTMKRARRKNYDPLPPAPRGPEYFLKALRIWGVTLTVQGDRVIAHGAAVSPVLQAEVAKRSRELIAAFGLEA